MPAPLLTVVAFSKDRACQLDLLLRSADALVAGWRSLEPTVLYTTSSDAHEQGYARVRRLHPHVRLVRERGDFKADTLALLDERRPGTMFLVDDDVFLRPFDPAGADVRRVLPDPRILALSLRLGPEIDYFYVGDRPVAPPPLGPDRTWRWRGLDGDWGYPMSLDGNVFRTAEILPAIARAAFANPNGLEEALYQSPLPHPLLACTESPRLVGVPANRVQDVAPNRHMGGSVDELLDRFLAGARLAHEPLLDLRTRSVHHEVEFVWEDDAEVAAA